uniref:Protein tyrosine phosphatase type IVA 3 n=1 Tax=Crocodylus porosus TaxID=8502 RepID=A0A7M4F464_CROPO
MTRPRWKRTASLLWPPPSCLSEGGPPPAASSGSWARASLQLPFRWSAGVCLLGSCNSLAGEGSLRRSASPAAPSPRDWPFDDGAPPPSKIVDDWLNLLKTKFCEDPGCCVAVHCVAGLGRAPVLVALALIESGMKYEDAIQFIRQKRRGAINSKQLTYLEKYRPKQRLRFKDPHNHKNKCCIM